MATEVLKGSALGSILDSVGVGRELLDDREFGYYWREKYAIQEEVNKKVGRGYTKLLVWRKLSPQEFQNRAVRSDENRFQQEVGLGDDGVTGSVDDDSNPGVGRKNGSQSRSQMKWQRTLMHPPYRQ